ncbi:MAG TPA: hypothetical protein VGD26_09425 [Chitinophagaceae bacterium]
MAVYNQLSLLDDFDKYTRRDERLVNELLNAISNFKFFRVNVRFTDFEKRDQMEELLSQILYWVAWIAWKKAKYIDDYRDDYRLDRFLAFTKEASGLSVTEPKTREEMSDYFRNAHRRIKTTFMAYRDILQGETEATKRILRHFDEIHNLTYE